MSDLLVRCSTIYEASRRWFLTLPCGGLSPTAIVAKRPGPLTYCAGAIASAGFIASVAGFIASAGFMASVAGFIAWV
ncbi:hypothetical protein, partial [Mesorhizobium sp. M1A.F.Ca.IN.020.03.2.1]|uniref:hypothetical protein n=1 Tax=Mesorhizobium sp. M1A.F.Ca.IN.020.03.2.1 TaxID=2496769 RepID=UPI0013E3C660